MARVNGKKGEYSLALESIRAAIDRAPARALYQYELGRILRDAGKLPEAVEAWKQAVKLEPGLRRCVGGHGRGLPRDQPIQGSHRRPSRPRSRPTRRGRGSWG